MMAKSGGKVKVVCPTQVSRYWSGGLRKPARPRLRKGGRDAIYDAGMVRQRKRLRLTIADYLT